MTNTWESPATTLDEQGRYEWIKVLNEGSFGVVHLAWDNEEAQYVAIKRVPKSEDILSEELDLHSRLGYHPNIVSLTDAWETDLDQFLVLEYCAKGDLHQAILDGRGPQETEHIRHFILQLIDAVDHLHSRNVYHRDIKPENIMICADGCLKLADFGLATKDGFSEDAQVGSDRYMAPEQWDPEGEVYSTAKADIWSIGIVIINILAGGNPFDRPTLSCKFFKDFAIDRFSLLERFPKLSDESFNLLSHCLTINPDKRSLGRLRAAVTQVAAFTSDDAVFDDFAMESVAPEVVKTTANREPLATPCLTSPPVQPGQGFAWDNVAPSTIQPTLHPVLDNGVGNGSEGLPSAPASAQYSSMSVWQGQSLESLADSGLGLSIHSTADSASKPLNISTGRAPLPPYKFDDIAFGRLSQSCPRNLSKKAGGESKSWSDMLEEDEEEEQLYRYAFEAHKQMPRQLSADDSESDDHPTPRAIPEQSPKRSLAQFIPKRPLEKKSVPLLRGDNLPIGKYSPPKVTMDHWQALGEKRRGTTDRVKPHNSAVAEKRRVTYARESVLDPAKKLFSRSTWKYNFRRNDKKDNSMHRVQEWNKSADWRRREEAHSDQQVDSMQLDGGYHSGCDDDHQKVVPHHISGDGNDNNSVFEIDSHHSEDGDEWVGGWSNFHL